MIVAQGLFFHYNNRDQVIDSHFAVCSPLFLLDIFL